MKHVLLLAFCVLLSARVLSAQSFTVTLTPASQSITVGESATYSVVITPLNGYDASVFLSVSSPGLKGSAILSHTTSNSPYSNCTLTVKPSIADTGIKTITLTAQNGIVNTTATCTIATKKNVQWATIKMPVYYNSSSSMRSLGINPAGDITYVVKGSDYYGIQKFNYVFQYKNKAWSRSDVSLSENSISENTCAPFAYDKNGVLWCATHYGIVKYDGNFATVYTMASTPGIKSDYIQGVQIDQNGFPVFIAYYKQTRSEIHVIRYDGTTWSTFNTKKKSFDTFNQGNRFNFEFCIDKSNRLWIPSYEGLLRVQDTTQEVLTMPEPIETTVQIECDKDGGIWCLNNGRSISPTILSYFDGTQWKSIENSAIKGARSFIVDNDKNIWLIALSGLHVYDGVSWTNYTSANSPVPIIESHRAPLLAQDKDKNVWMLADDVFYVFNPNGLVNIPLAPSAVEEDIIPTPSDGITLYPNPTGSTFTISGISNVMGYSIVNTMGITVLPPQEFVSSKQEVDVSGLAGGVYFVQMRTASGMIAKPIVVVH
jgi:hypothetical protein